MEARSRFLHDSARHCRKTQHTGDLATQWGPGPRGAILPMYLQALACLTSCVRQRSTMPAVHLFTWLWL